MILGKRIQQINEREEVKYSAEEKEIEESESDEEQAKRTVAERREKIVKRLSVERSIPASTQKKEITREITEIKRKSLIEDKKAHHESEILMQLPADNVIIKTAAVPEQVIKMKMGKLDSTEVSKTDFDKELTHKLRTSGRSSEEEEQQSPDKVDKIIQDISTELNILLPKSPNQADRPEPNGRMLQDLHRWPLSTIASHSQPQSQLDSGLWIAVTFPMQPKWQQSYTSKSK